MWRPPCAPRPHATRAWLGVAPAVRTATCTDEGVAWCGARRAHRDLTDEGVAWCGARRAHRRGRGLGVAPAVRTATAPTRARLSVAPAV